METAKMAKQQLPVRDFDREVAAQMNSLIQTLRPEAQAYSGDLLRRNLRQILAQSFGGGITAFSRAARMHHNSLHDLIFGTARPGLDSLLRLAFAGGVDVLTLVQGELSAAGVWGQSPNPAISGFNPRTCRKYDWPAISSMLRSEVENMDQFPRSLASLCGAGEWDSGYVASHCRKAASELVRLYRQAAAQRRRQRELAEIEDIKAAVRVCLENWTWPSNRRLRSFIKTPGCVRNPKLEQERRRAVADELGQLHFSSLAGFE